MMTSEQLAKSALDYLTGKKYDLIPIGKEDVVTSTHEPMMVQTFIDNMEKRVIDEYNAEKRIGIVQEKVSYDVSYLFGFEDAGDFAIIFGVTDTLRTTYKKGDEVPTTEVINREINSVTIEAENPDFPNLVESLDLSTIKEYLYDYAAIHERVYEAFGTNRWKYVFKWDALPQFIKQQHADWDKNKSSEDREKGASLPPFTKFQKDTRWQLKKYLQEGKSEDFILQFIQEQLDTAHLYGMNEKRK